MVGQSQKLAFYMQLRQDSSVDERTEQAIRETTEKILKYKDEVNKHIFDSYRVAEDAHIDGCEEAAGPRVHMELTELDFNDISMMAYLTHVDRKERGLLGKIFASGTPLKRYTEMYQRALREHAEGQPLGYGFLPVELTDLLNNYEREDTSLASDEYEGLLDASLDYLRRFGNLYRLSIHADSLYNAQRKEMWETHDRIFREGDLSALMGGGQQDMFSEDELGELADMCEEQAGINMLRARLIHQSLFTMNYTEEDLLKNFYNGLLSSVSAYRSLELPNTDELKEHLFGYAGQQAS